VHKPRQLRRDLQSHARGADIRVMRYGRVVLLAALMTVLLLPAGAAAQSRTLVVPTIAASAAAAADWASTYHALEHFRVRETNPVLRPFSDSPAQLVAVGALMDAGALTAWNLTVGRRKPRLAAAGLWALAGFRTYLTIRNLRNTQIAARR
jgi:hypothetical protein